MTRVFIIIIRIMYNCYSRRQTHKRESRVSKHVTYICTIRRNNTASAVLISTYRNGLVDGISRTLEPRPHAAQAHSGRMNKVRFPRTLLPHAQYSKRVRILYKLKGGSSILNSGLLIVHRARAGQIPSSGDGTPTPTQSC